MRDFSDTAGIGVDGVEAARNDCNPTLLAVDPRQFSQVCILCDDDLCFGYWKVFYDTGGILLN